ncbi:MAG: NAD(P)/FAD-dependent oxidoreductase [Erysipelotrichaceae bacterium]|jgi:predicted Rossmann fold flavoprotein|nr:NAD(P)/FAD-dependent oxidoreductase [Erysipelotrichaceae bacterium]
MSEVIVIGGGASGMMCAALLGRNGIKTTLIEHNEKLGKKLFITGKGRCNFTNACDEQTFLSHVVSNPKFLYRSIYHMNADQVMHLFESWGMPYQVERGRRVFPASNHSYDVIDTLKRELKKGNVKVLLNTEVKEICCKEDGSVKGVNVLHSSALGNWKKEENAKEINHERSQIHGSTEFIPADTVVIATGGLSYPSTGSLGDGYRFAKDLGMQVTDCLPSLVPIDCKEKYLYELRGFTLKNVTLHVKDGKKDLFNEQGELTFTSSGITGPLTLKLSASCGPLISKKPLQAWIDLKPAVTEEQLDKRLLRLFETDKNHDLESVMHKLFPSRMIPVMEKVTGISFHTVIHDVTKEDRKKLINATKHFPLILDKLRGYSEAIITKGGISVKELNPGTMEAKKVPGLYCVGEVIDTDAYTGGYNLQIAWSTAALAAKAIIDKTGQ